MLLFKKLRRNPWKSLWSCSPVKEDTELLQCLIITIKYEKKAKTGQKLCSRLWSCSATKAVYPDPSSELQNSNYQEEAAMVLRLPGVSNRESHEVSCQDHRWGHQQPHPSILPSSFWTVHVSLLSGPQNRTNENKILSPKRLKNSYIMWLF